MLGLSFCARAFSSCGKRGPLFITVRRPLTLAASLVAEHRLQTRRLSNCGSRAQLLRGIWDLPRPGLEPVSPALAGRFSSLLFKNYCAREFPGSPGVRTPCSHCQGHGSVPGRGTKIPHAVWRCQKKKSAKVSLIYFYKGNWLVKRSMYGYHFGK